MEQKKVISLKASIKTFRGASIKITGVKKPAGTHKPTKAWVNTDIWFLRLEGPRGGVMGAIYNKRSGKISHIGKVLAPRAGLTTVNLSNGRIQYDFY